jgi:hypothetical protein
MGGTELVQLAIETYIHELDDDEFSRLIAITRPNLAVKQGVTK